MKKNPNKKKKIQLTNLFNEYGWPPASIQHFVNNTYILETWALAMDFTSIRLCLFFFFAVYLTSTHTASLTAICGFGCEMTKFASHAHLTCGSDINLGRNVSVSCTANARLLEEKAGHKLPNGQFGCGGTLTNPSEKKNKRNQQKTTSSIDTLGAVPLIAPSCASAYVKVAQKITLHFRSLRAPCKSLLLLIWAFLVVWVRKDTSVFYGYLLPAQAPGCMSSVGMLWWASLLIGLFVIAPAPPYFSKNSKLGIVQGIKERPLAAFFSLFVDIQK